MVIFNRGLLLSIAACLALAIACDEDDDGDGCLCDSGATGDTDVDADADADSDTDGCFETWTSFEGAVEHAGAYVGADAIVIEAYEGLQGQGCGYGAVAKLALRDAWAGDYSLEPPTDLFACDKCILLGTNCSIANPASCQTHFVATEGLLDLVMIVEDEPWDDYFAFVAEDLVLAEYTVDWGAGVAEPVPDGEKVCIDFWHMALTLVDWN